MFYKNFIEAHEAAQKLRRQHGEDGIMVKVVKSNYGGFQIKLIPVDMLADELANNYKDSKISRSVACF